MGSCVMGIKKKQYVLSLFMGWLLLLGETLMSIKPTKKRRYFDTSVPEVLILIDMETLQQEFNGAILRKVKEPQARSGITETLLEQ